MKLRVNVDGDEYELDLTLNRSESEYRLRGVMPRTGSASIVEVMPGVYSVLVANRSFQVRVAASGEALEVWAGAQRHSIMVSDVRDRAGKPDAGRTSGPQEVRALMPGKVIRLLINQGETVAAGQGIIVIEAMKMQNEMKSPKGGVVKKVCVAQGATVAAGEILMVVD